MTTKYLTGAYPGGYTLNAKYYGLVIEATATVGGTGVSAARDVPITNFGSIAAAAGADGIDLAAGGIVTNGSTISTHALISGDIGVLVSGATGTVVNFGTIEGRYRPFFRPDPYRGVYLSAGGEVTNGSSSDTTALIAGGYGVFVGGAAGTVVNYGSIQGIDSVGIRMNAGGMVINGSNSDVTATVSGSEKYTGGIYILHDSGTVLNFGRVQGVQRGVYLYSGHLVNGSNLDISSLIEGEGGVSVRGAATISNYGTILGTYRRFGPVAVGMNGGVLTNGSAGDTAALIEGYSGIISPAQTTISNYGTIMGTGMGTNSAGVLMYGGVLTNGSAADTTALIEGYDGIHNRTQQGSIVTISNFGTIIGGGGQYGYGISTYGGVVTNGSAGDATALIEGYVGVLSHFAGITLTNFGTIEGTGGVAVHFQDANSLLVVEGGSVFEGAVEGGGGALNLASGKGSILAMGGGDITVSDKGRTANFTDFPDLTISKGAQFTLTGFGVISAKGESLRVNGLLAVSGELLAHGRLDGAGTVAIKARAFVEIDAPTASLLTFGFRGVDATLALAEPYNFGALIAGFAATDTIDLLSITATSAVLGAGDTLVITNGSTAVATLKLTGNYTGDTFTTKSDGSGGTDIAVTTGGAVAPPSATVVSAPHAFIAAAASFGAASGAVYATPVAHAVVWRTILSAPRAMVV